MRIPPFVLPVLLAALLAACAASAQDPAPAIGSVQLIIKFREPAQVDPARLVDTLSRDAGVPVVYVRPMSGGAHVFAAKGSIEPDRLGEILKRLSARTDVEYAVENRRKRHQ